MELSRIDGGIESANATGILRQGGSLSWVTNPLPSWPDDCSYPKEIYLLLNSKTLRLVRAIPFPCLRDDPHPRSFGAAYEICRLPAELL